MSGRGSILIAGLCLLLASLACSISETLEVNDSIDATRQADVGRTVVYEGTGEKTSHFIDEDQCTSQDKVTLTVNPDKSVVLRSVGKSFTFGGTVRGCHEGPDETWTIAGTISDDLITFKECNGGAAAAEGEASIHRNVEVVGENVTGSLSCTFTMQSSGEKTTPMNLSFDLLRVP